ncbi:MAG: alpha-glucan family phosphorylase [Myxococcota bacterium]
MAPTVAKMLEHLASLASNLWWSWDAEAADLWAQIDPFRWDRYGHNPVVMLRDVEPERWATLAASPYADRVEATWQRFQDYLAAPGWCAGALPELVAGGVAYFSMEFGLHESLHTYSGGLGVLAGDHLRSASDLGIPLVGVTLLYRQGYFRQLIEDGRQLAAYPEADWSRLPVRPCLDADGEAQLEVQVPMEDRTITVRVWQLDVGRCRLLLLDTDHDANTPADRSLTRQLYGGDERTRIGQEVVLAFGGVRALDALKLDVCVYHLNEGHCAFVPVAWAGDRVDDGFRFEEALDAIRARCVFTTHTPVPAGHDRFYEPLVRSVLGPWCEDVGLEVDALMDLGRVTPGDADETLCMTVIALKSASASNG